MIKGGEKPVRPKSVVSLQTMGRQDKQKDEGKENDDMDNKVDEEKAKDCDDDDAN